MYYLLWILGMVMVIMLTAVTVIGLDKKDYLD